MTYTYTTKGVCSRAIEIAIEDGIIAEVRFVGGCHGNTQGVAALVKGSQTQFFYTASNVDFPQVAAICKTGISNSHPYQCLSHLPE